MDVNVALAIVRGMWNTAMEMSPYLLLGFGVAGVLYVLIPPNKVQKHLGGRGLLPSLKAALFGVPLPLCSCSVIPVAASLRKHGAGRGAVASFLLSTPQTGADSILVTYSLLGPLFAIFRPIVAFVSGVVGGILVETVDRTDPAVTDQPVCRDECCVAKEKQENRIWKALRYGYVTLPRDLVKPMIVGLVVAGVIGGVVPDDFFRGLLGGGFLAMVLMTLIAAPMYVCATASIPIAMAMIEKGVSPGVALVFLVAGPGTSAATIAAIWSLLGKRSAIMYLVVVIATAWISGLTLDWLFAAAPVLAAHVHEHHEAGGGFKFLSAVVLCTIFVSSMLRRPRAASAALAGGNRIQVAGMTCGHCEDSVRKAVGAVKGVLEVQVSAKSGELLWTGDGVEEEDVIRAIEKAGFHVEPKGSV